MKWVKNITYFLSLILIFVLLTYLICYLIPFNKLGESNQIKIMDRNENLLIETHYENEGKYLKIDEINEDFIYAFIASEDENFYRHIGFSLKGIIRAIYLNITTDKTQGGSSISQQLARTLFLDNEKTIIRKIKEAILTICLEMHYDKQMIIEQYLNSIYLGHNIYGIEQASTYYFNKTNKELSLDEIALIVGIANAPNINAPDINYFNAINRRNYVLDRLYDIEYISKDKLEYYKAKETKINVLNDKYKNPSTHICYYIINQLKKLNLYDKQLLAKGIKVYTTIDQSIQRKLYEAILKNNPNDNSEIASVVVKVNSGDILGFVSGYELSDQYNRVMNAYRPIGSTIKPLLYYLALKYGFTPTTFLSVNKQDFIIDSYGTYSPSNATNLYSTSPINMIEAIGLSDNIYATKTLLYLGINNFSVFLKRFNIESKNVPSIALGVDETSLINLVSIYNCFASLGVYHQPRLISKITTSDGKILYHQEESGLKKLQRPYTFIINQLLTSPFDENLIDYAKPTLLNYIPKYKYAAKTGSDAYNAYTIGFNPLYTIGVWTGTDQNTPFENKNVSKKVFLDVCNEITNKNIWYNPPSYILSKTIDPITGKENKRGSTYWFIKDY